MDLAVGTGDKLSKESTALPKVDWIARLGGLPDGLTWPPAAAGARGLRWTSEELAMDMEDPDKALVTETCLPVGKLGQQPSLGTSVPSAVARG